MSHAFLLEVRARVHGTVQVVTPAITPQLATSERLREAETEPRSPSSASRLRRMLGEFREGDQRAIAEPVGGKPLAGALLTVGEGLETHDPCAEPLHDLTAGQQ